MELKPRIAVKPFWHDIWEPVWEAVEHTGLVLNFHSDIGLLQPRGTPEDRETKRMVNQALIGSIGKMANAEYLGTLILSGVLERHPRITLVVGETDISWLPTTSTPWTTWSPSGSTTPDYRCSPANTGSDSARRHSRTRGLPRWCFPIGVDNVIWASDYPHPDGTWPASQQVLREHLASLSEADRHRVLYTNAASLYGFPQAAPSLVGAGR